MTANFVKFKGINKKCNLFSKFRDETLLNLKTIILDTIFLLKSMKIHNIYQIVKFVRFFFG